MVTETTVKKMSFKKNKNIGMKRGLRIIIFCAPWNITTLAILSLYVI